MKDKHLNRLVGMMKDTRNRERAEELMRIAKSKNAATKPLYDSYLACLADLKLTKVFIFFFHSLLFYFIVYLLFAC